MPAAAGGAGPRGSRVSFRKAIAPRQSADRESACDPERHKLSAEVVGFITSGTARADVKREPNVHYDVSSLWSACLRGTHRIPNREN
jgi:hypothetical protein